MKHTICPYCEKPVHVGSHRDCVFDLLAEWVAHRKPVEKKSEVETLLQKEEAPNG